MSSPLARPAGAAVAWRAVEMGGARVISLIRFFILAKLLAPDDFGLLAIALVAIEVLLSLTDFGMIPSLIQRRDPEPRHYDAAWTVEVLRAGVVSGILIVGAPMIAELFNEPRATPILRSLAVAVFIGALGSARLADLTRNLQFRPLAVMELATALVEAIVSIALASALGVWALVAGVIAASVARTVSTWLLAPYRPRPTLARDAVRPLLAFGQWMFVTVIASMAGDAVLRWEISRRLSTDDVGLYYVAFRLAMLPKLVVTDIVRPVAFPVYAGLQHAPGDAAGVYRATIVAAAAVLVPAYALLVALAPPIVEALLGDRWIGAEPLVRLLALAGCASLVAECTIPLVQGLGHPRLAALVFGARSVIVIWLAWGLTGEYGVVGAAFAWLLAEVVVQLLAAAVAQRTYGSVSIALGPPLAAIAAAAVGSVAVAWLVYESFGGVIGLVMAIGIAAATSLALLGALDRYFGLGLLAGVMLVFPALGRLLPPSLRETDA